jgi:para-aminobenzoate synthetase/4-amino-4-deoxychorismate lyase
MGIIRELEDGPRGVYCGAVGMVAPPDAPFRARFNVAIRTVLIDRSTDTGTYGTGGGITWGSDPDAEYAELRVKAEVLARCSGRELSPGAGTPTASPSFVANDSGSMPDESSPSPRFTG